MKKIFRNNNPKENIYKLKEVLDYIFPSLGKNWNNIGIISIILYFIDLNFYEIYEKQLIGLKYTKTEDNIRIVNFEKYMIESNIISKTKKLKLHEKEVVNNVIHKYCKLGMRLFVKYLQWDIPWVTSDVGQVIDYEAVFYRTRGYSVRKYLKEKK